MTHDPDALELVRRLMRDSSWLSGWVKAYAVGTHPDPSVVMPQIAADLEEAQARITALESTPPAEVRREVARETKAEEIKRLQSEIGQRQSRLQFLVLGDQTKGVTGRAADMLGE
jgi:hypothetical protein